MKSFEGNITLANALALNPQGLLTYYAHLLEWYQVQERTDLSYRDSNYRHAEVVFTLANLHTAAYLKIPHVMKSKHLNNANIKRDMQLYLTSLLAYEYDFSYVLPYADMLVGKLQNPATLQEVKDFVEDYNNLPF